MGATPEQQTVLDLEDVTTPLLTIEQMVRTAALDGVDTVAKRIARRGRNPLQDNIDLDNLQLARDELLAAAEMLRKYRLGRLAEHPKKRT